MYNILTFNTHERYQTQLAKTGHNFFHVNYEGGKTWDSDYADQPENVTQLNASQIPDYIEFDFILSQSKFGQFQISQQLSEKLNIPVISLEHTAPLRNWTVLQTEKFRRMTGTRNVFITDWSRQKWNMEGDVINHCVDTEVFSPYFGKRYPNVLTVANDFVNRDYALNYYGWDRITKDMERVVVGSTPGLSEPAKSVQDLAERYQQCGVYINTTTLSPVPTSMLEAMSCGCVVVSTDTCAIPGVIEDGSNGFLFDVSEEKQMREKIQEILKNPEQYNHVGMKAHETIKEKFSVESFVGKWNNLFKNFKESFIFVDNGVI